MLIILTTVILIIIYHSKCLHYYIDLQGSLGAFGHLSDDQPITAHQHQRGGWTFGLRCDHLVYVHSLRTSFEPLRSFPGRATVSHVAWRRQCRRVTDDRPRIVQSFELRQPRKSIQPLGTQKCESNDSTSVPAVHGESAEIFFCRVDLRDAFGAVSLGKQCCSNCMGRFGPIVDYKRGARRRSS